MKTFLTRTVTGVLFVAIMVAGFLRPEAMILLFALITGMTAWEFTGLMNERDNVNINRFITTASAVYFYLAVAGFCSGMTPSAVFIPYLLTVIYLFVSELYTKAPDSIANWAYSMMAQMYVALPLSCINALAFRSDGNGILFSTLLPLSVFVFLWMNDTGAYLIGSMLGRHKLFPRISPGKSWEGSLGGGIVVVIVAAAVAYIDSSALIEEPTGLTAMQWIGMGLVVVSFGTWGDLVESLLKRTLGIKDSGNILPGHGGMLDRFDSSLMAIPAAVVYLYTITLF